MRTSRAFTLLALAATAGVLFVVLAAREREETSMHVLDIGQGDAILLRSGATDVLVDGGPDAAVLRQLGRVRPAWDRRIEVLVLTHPEQDHLAGFLPLLERERVELLVLPRIPSSSDLFRAFVADVRSRGIAVRFAVPGQRIVAPNLVLTVLAPSPRALALTTRSANNGSVVLRADVGSAFTALLTGDIERGAEHLLVQEQKPALDVDVLKVPHHGSRTSTTLRLLAATTPALAIISAGADNRFGHPHPSVLARLHAVPLLRTDTHGTVSFTTRAGHVRLSCEHAGRGDAAERTEREGERLPCGGRLGTLFSTFVSMANASRSSRKGISDLKAQRTLVLIKPDGVQRHLVGEILHRFERAGLKIVGLKLVWATPEMIAKHYRQDDTYLRSIGEKTIAGMQKLGLPVVGTAVDIGRRVRSYLSNHLSISPVVAMVLQGTNAISNVRQLIGVTDPILADVGSIRGDLTIDTIQLANMEERSVRNLLHASGDEGEAEREIAIWFSPTELYAYRTVMDVVLHDEHWDRPQPRSKTSARRPAVRRRH